MINVHVTISDFSYEYYNYMCENYLKTATTHKVNFHAYCLDDKSFEKAKKHGDVYKVPKATGTAGHCNAIKEALQNFSIGQEQDINIIADSDTVMLALGWDEIVVDILDNVGVLGSSFEKIGGKCSGSGTIQMYKDQPTFTWFAASKKYDFSKLETVAHKHSHLSISDDELSQLYKLPIGFSLLRDTGWQIPAYLRDNEIPYSVLDQVKHNTGARVLKTGHDYHEEYQLKGYPLVGHQRGSLSKAFRQDTLSKSFYNVVDAHITALGIK